MEIRNILLPVDGSESRIRFLSFVKDLAVAFEANITVLHVQQKYSTLPVPALREYRFRAKNFKKLKNVVLKYDKNSFSIVNRIKRDFRGSGIKITPRIEAGNPAETIIEIAEKENFDVIIMCSHGISANKAFSLGSVTSKVVHYSNKPVLIVKHDFCKVIDLNIVRKR